MIITDYYTLKPSPSRKAFYFISEGRSGTFTKLVHFEWIQDDLCFNLALAVWQDGEWVDDLVTNNDDFVKTISTVAKAVYDFLETYPDEIIQIKANEPRRNRVYNGIFRRRWDEIEDLFDVQGILAGGGKEPYQLEKIYEGFELTLRKA